MGAFWYMRCGIMIIEGVVMEAKKYLIVLVLRILETNTDESNTLTQIKIAEMISAKYPCDRKTVGRNIKYLKDIGYPIVKTTSGFYMDHRAFSKNEIEFVLDLVRNAECDRFDKSDLSTRLFECLSRYYKRG